MTIDNLLNSEELKITKELIDLSLRGAAKAFTSIARGRIEISSSWGGVDRFIERGHEDLGEVIVLVTEVKGEIEGVCFLLFLKDEVENFLDASLPAEIAEEPHKRLMMGDAFLMETDNIISASVITHFANILQKKMYGDVPALERVDYTGLEDYIMKFKEKDDHLLLFKTKFQADHINMNPEFIWLMKKEFVNAIRENMVIENLQEKILNAKV